MELKDRLQSALASSYTLERELGGGGMSRVFLAHETALGRQVVLKVLGPDLIAGMSAERFAREVRLAASLQHPNIVPVLTTGVADGLPYYTMPYVKGESLRTRINDSLAIPMRHSISILRDVARALQYAHNEGVVHRDIKPDNVLLSGDAAVVTDFGIAKAISIAREGTPDETRVPTTLTQAGSTMGTPAYMAPEQVAADPIDNRVDIYAWGLMAYELLAGAHPFTGRGSAAQIMAAQLTEDPQHLREKAPSTPPQLADLVMRCLAKPRESRPASATDLLDGLDVTHTSHEIPALPAAGKRRRILIAGLAAGVLAIAVGVYAFTAKRTSTAQSIDSVAVLPFDHDRADSAEAYFGEGIADEIMTSLGKIPGLRVASRTSAIALGSRNDLDVREIASRLGVASVVEGTVRRSGGQLRITAQLTNARDGLTMWSDAFNRETRDVFAVQAEITQAILTALKPELSTKAQSSSHKGPGTSDPEAYDLYLRGLYLIERRGPGVAKAAEYFTEAIEKDPGFARAYGGLSNALVLLPYFGGVPAHRVDERVRANADRALKLDPSLAEPRVALAMAHWHALRWNDADREFRKAIETDSASAVARTQYGRYLITTGRVREGLQHLRVARNLDPLSPTSYVWLSRGLSFLGDHAGAAEVRKRSLELDPNLLNNRTVLVFDLVHQGMFKEALAVTGESSAPTPFDGMMAYNLELSGAKDRARAIRNSLEQMPDTVWTVHIARAWAYIATGDTARALSEMEAALANRETIQAFVPFVDRVYDPLRKSPRFAEIVRKLGLDGHGLTGPTGGRPAM